MGTLFWLAVVLLVGGLIYGLLYASATLKWQATFADEGTVEARKTGGKVKDFFMDMKGFILTKDEVIKPTNRANAAPGEAIATPKEIREARKDESLLARFLRVKWGIHWVSWFYPWTRIDPFPVHKVRLVEAARRKEGMEIKDLIEEDPEPVMVYGLRVRINRPFYVPNIETSDNRHANAVVACVFRVVLPRVVHVQIRKDLFTVLQSVIAGVTNDYVNSMTYEAFSRADKGKGSKFSDLLMEINEGKSTNAPHGIVKDFGIRLIDGWMEAQDLTKEDKEDQETLKAQARAKDLGKAEVIAAKYREQAARHDAIAENASLAERGRVIEAMPTGVAMHVTELGRTENLGKGNLNVLAGDNTSLLINTPAWNPTPNPNNMGGKPSGKNRPPKKQPSVKPAPAPTPSAAPPGTTGTP